MDRGCKDRMQVGMDGKRWRTSTASKRQTTTAGVGLAWRWLHRTAPRPANHADFPDVPMRRNPIVMDLIPLSRGGSHGPTGALRRSKTALSTCIHCWSTHRVVGKAYTEKAARSCSSGADSGGFNGTETESTRATPKPTFAAKTLHRCQLESLRLVLLVGGSRSRVGGLFGTRAVAERPSKIDG